MWGRVRDVMCIDRKREEKEEKGEKEKGLLGCM